jgi:alkylation response protein AidB-like acyl-CoA dehydrogenase
VTEDDPSTGLLDELRAFLARELPEHRAEFGDSSDFTARRVWQRRLASGRWVGLSWPVEHGGRGLPVPERLRCELEMGYADTPPLAGPLGVANVGPTLIAWGTPEQQRHLSPILDASEIWCQGFSEPDAGSDLAGLRTVALVDDDGGFEITGRKIWTTNGLEATHCLLLARTDRAAPKHRGISALLVPMDLPGIERRPIRQMDGGQEFAEMTFDAVRVGPGALLGPLHDGWRVTMTTLAHERAGVISQAVLLERDVLREVRAMRGLVGDVGRQELAQRFIEGRVLAMFGHRALAALAGGGAPGPEHALIRLAQGLLRQRLADTRVRLRGLDAVATAGETLNEPGRELLSARSASIAAGTREILKNVVGERVLGLPRE